MSRGSAGCSPFIQHSTFNIQHSTFAFLMRPIPKTGPLNATVAAPPSKSYSVRALLLGAMAEGPTTITNCLDADDTRYALEALRTIGFQIGGSFKEGLRIGDRKSISANEVPIFIGNAGTAMRFLTGWLAFT